MTKIVSLGYYFNNSLVDKNIDFGDKESVLGVDILIVDLYSLVDEYVSNYSLDSFGELRTKGKNILNTDIERRTIEIQDVLKHGGSVFFLIPPKNKLYGIDLEDVLQRVAFTGGNFNSYFKLINSACDGVSINKIVPLNPFFEENIDFFDVKSYFDNKHMPIYTEYSGGLIKPSIPLTVKNSSVPLALYYKLKNNGNLFFIPRIKTREVIKKGYKKYEDSFLLSSIDLVFNLGSSCKQDVEFPNWLNRYVIFNENESLNKIKFNEEEISRLQKKMEIQIKNLQAIQEYKLILSSSGEVLEQLVENIFKDLGFEIVKNIKSNRVDFTLKYKNKTFVVEVKGKTKSAAEKDARQLHVWVAEHSLETEKEPKGLLIVNTFRDIPIDKRKEASFPFSSGTVVQKNEFCLMTTLQLLCLYIDCKNNPAKTDKIVNKIFKCTGELSEYQNWQDYIELKD